MYHVLSRVSLSEMRQLSRWVIGVTKSKRLSAFQPSNAAVVFVGNGSVPKIVINSTVIFLNCCQHFVIFEP